MNNFSTLNASKKVIAIASIVILPAVFAAGFFTGKHIAGEEFLAAIEATEEQNSELYSDEGFDEETEEGWRTNDLEIDAEASPEEQAAQMEIVIADFVAKYDLAGSHYYIEEEGAFYGCIDLNADGIATEEEIIEVLTVGYEFLIEVSGEQPYTAVEDIRYSDSKETTYTVKYVTFEVSE